jgi:hypothetical protein
MKKEEEGSGQHEKISEEDKKHCDRNIMIEKPDHGVSTLVSVVNPVIASVSWESQ